MPRGPRREQSLTAAGYRKAAQHLSREGADGIYLFNFFTRRERGSDAFEPPFEVLREIGDFEDERGRRRGGGATRLLASELVSDHVLAPAPGGDKVLAAVAAEHYNLTWVPVRRSAQILAPPRPRERP